MGRNCFDKTQMPPRLSCTVGVCWDGPAVSALSEGILFHLAPPMVLFMLSSEWPELESEVGDRSVGC